MDPNKPRLVSSAKTPARRPPWVWALVGCGGVALLGVVAVGVLAWMWSRSLGSLSENVPLEMAQAIVNANPGTDLGVTEADASSLPDWIPRREDVEIKGFTAKGGGLLMGTSTATVDEVLDFYLAELTAAGFKIPSLAGQVREEDSGLVHAMSPDGCRSVTVVAGHEEGGTQISYQFHDCTQAPGEPKGASGWARPLPDGPPRATGKTRALDRTPPPASTVIAVSNVTE